MTSMFEVVMGETRSAGVAMAEMPTLRQDRAAPVAMPVRAVRAAQAV
jgi:hypothetical protein